MARKHYTTSSGASPWTCTGRPRARSWRASPAT